MTALVTKPLVLTLECRSLMLLLVGLSAAPAQVQSDDVETGHRTLGRAVLQEILDPPWLTERRNQELATRDQFKAFIGFSFTDRQP